MIDMTAAQKLITNTAIMVKITASIRLESLGFVGLSPFMLLSSAPWHSTLQLL
jgi:hypothetical protein